MIVKANAAPTLRALGRPVDIASSGVMREQLPARLTARRLARVFWLNCLFARWRLRLIGLREQKIIGRIR